MRVVALDGLGRLLDPEVGLEPGRQDVRLPVPPGLGERLASQEQQRLARGGVGDAVEGQQVGNVNLPGRMAAKLDPADLGIRAPDGLGGLLRGDPARLAQTAECGAEPDPQDHWPCRRGLSHGAAQDIALVRPARDGSARSIRSDRHDSCDK